MKVLLISLTVVITDQLSKIYVKGISLPSFNIYIDGLIPGVKYPLLGDFINLTLVENPGIAFGINPGEGLKSLLTLVTLMIAVGLVVFLYKSREDGIIKRSALALLIGGAVGNLLDRFFYGVIFGTAPFLKGNVVDFFNIRITDFLLFEQMIGSYVFNIADISVSIGLILMIISVQTGTQPEIDTLAADQE